MNEENTTQELEEENSVKNQFTTVTTLSKYLALLLFITIPFIGGWIGYTYAPEKIVEVEKIVISESKNLNNNTEFSEEEFISSWRHHNGIMIMHKEIGLSPDGVSESSARTLTAFYPDGTSYLLSTSSIDRLGRNRFFDGRFSPLGNYFVVVQRGMTEAYNLVTGKESVVSDEYQDNFNEPYWNSDESKVLIIRSGRGIDGTPPMIGLSRSGNPADISKVFNLDEFFGQDPNYEHAHAVRTLTGFNNVTSDTERVYFDVSYSANQRSDNMSASIIFNFETEELTLINKIQRYE